MEKKEEKFLHCFFICFPVFAQFSPSLSHSSLSFSLLCVLSLALSSPVFLLSLSSSYIISLRVVLFLSVFFLYSSSYISPVVPSAFFTILCLSLTLTPLAWRCLTNSEQVNRGEERAFFFDWRCSITALA